MIETGNWDDKVRFHVEGLKAICITEERIEGLHRSFKKELGRTTAARVPWISATMSLEQNKNLCDTAEPDLVRCRLGLAEHLLRDHHARPMPCQRDKAARPARKCLECQSAWGGEQQRLARDANATCECEDEGKPQGEAICLRSPFCSLGGTLRCMWKCMWHRPSA